MAKDIPRKWKQKRAGVAILIPDNIDFKAKMVTRDKDGHYIMIRWPISQEDITIINIYAPNIGAPKCIKQILTDLKGEIDNNPIIVGDFNTPLSTMDRLSRQKIKRKCWT